MRVPEYTPEKIETNRTALPQINTNAPIEAFGGGAAMLGTAQAANNLLGTGREMVMEQKKQADDAVSMKVYDQLLQQKNQLLYDPKTGAMTRRGQDALGAVEEYNGQFDKFSNDIESTLSNEDQRIMYARMKARVATDLNDTLQRHTYSEAEKYKVEVANTTMRTVVDDAILNWHQKGKVDESVEMVKGLAAETARAQGLHDLVPQKEKEAASKVYAGVIDRMLATGEDLKAKEYYEKVKEEMTQEDTRPLLKSMEVGSTRAESQRLAEQITTKYGDMGTALQEVKKLPYGELRDQVKARIKDHYQDLRQADEERDRINFDNASEIVEKSGGRGNIPPQLLAGLPSAKIQALEERARQLKSGARAEPNSQAYYDLMNIAANNPTLFKSPSFNLREYNGKITDAEMAQMIKDKFDKSGASSKELDGYRTNQQIVDTTASAMGIKKDEEAMKAFTDEVDRRVRLEARQKGRPLNNEEIQSITDVLAAPVIQKGTGINIFSSEFWGGSRRLYEADPTKQVEVDFESIPKVELNKIRAALNKNKIPFSETTALEMYTKKVGKFRAK